MSEYTTDGGRTWHREAGKTPAGKFYAVRQFASGRVLGSRIMTGTEAEREVTMWRQEIGPAVMVPDSPAIRRMVHRDDSGSLAEVLASHDQD